MHRRTLLNSAAVTAASLALQRSPARAIAGEFTGKIKKAERDVLRQFRGTPTESLVNPLLAEWEHALNTDSAEFEPVLEFDAEAMDFGAKDRQRLLRLTCQAIATTFDDAMSDKSSWESASLGPEDVRFLEVLKAMSD